MGMCAADLGTSDFHFSINRMGEDKGFFEEDEKGRQVTAQMIVLGWLSVIFGLSQS
ncbi:hypothetical protein LG52_97 [Geobacillus kaustophilus]|uniref:Uncharacterized protein n=1 Tax=Geobacillus kaustophilus TaxID=1462 RepID=A0A0D8BQ28_GEOKU|nr:hypothetical protein [Geobacillus kaustophilus]KJE26119.1 hypothetical protein LG52_97 [Geobacillus kaustophilus]